MDWQSYAETNLYAGWLGLMLGLLVGALAGLFFRREDWLGGYGSWRRRMVRLAHISLIGLGFLNIAFALTWIHLQLSLPPLVSFCFLAGACTMPLVCCLAAWRQGLRHLFPVPVSLLFSGVALLLKGLLR